MLRFDVETIYKATQARREEMRNGCGLMQKQFIKQHNNHDLMELQSCGLMQKQFIKQPDLFR